MTGAGNTVWVHFVLDGFQYASLDGYGGVQVLVRGLADLLCFEVKFGQTDPDFVSGAQNAALYFLSIDIGTVAAVEVLDSKPPFQRMDPCMKSRHLWIK
jgi:hypothetical protein